MKVMIEKPPSPKSVNLNTDRQKISILDAEDEIISIFCQNNGGMEFAMPIIRKQFSDASVDFKNPTKEGLIEIINKLVAVTKEFQGAEVAKGEYRDYMHIIKKIDA